MGEWGGGGGGIGEWAEPVYATGTAQNIAKFIL